MRSKQLNLPSYDTDKIQHDYLELYDPILSAWTDKEIKLLEIGIHRGGSLKLWRDYFPRGRIVGIDLELPRGFVPGERIQIFEGSQADTRFLSEVATKTAPEGFDVIIDDASHIGELTKRTFWHLFDRHLKPGGLYAIEDWGTGYLDDFPDGKKFDPKPSAIDPFPCHSHGMVGFVKELVDEQGAASVAVGRAVGEYRASKFTQLLITPCIVFVRKMAPALSASPNPVPTSEGSGRTTISWNSVDGKIYFSESGRDEVLFADSPRGSQDADWIREGASYEFRLYNFGHTELLAKVRVDAPEMAPPAVHASPNPVPASEGLGETTISWNSVDGAVYVSVNGGNEMLFADSPRGAEEANWIEGGSHYEFRLYNAGHNELLSKVVVTMAASGDGG
jgi:hypothetical protein